jgi:tRNA A37 threonylcarbamoyladenosine dehydratase
MVDKKSKIIDAYKLSKKVLKDIKEEKAHKERMEQIEPPTRYKIKKSAEKIGAKLSAALNKRVQSRAILKKQPQGSVVFSTEQPRSKYFKQEWERARWV